MLDLIASALGRGDEVPNIELALKLAEARDADGIAEIVSGLGMGKAVANDCVKVLYEIGEREPSLIAAHVDVFLDLLKSKNNRLVWGGMTALGQITAVCPEKVFARLDEVCAAFEIGSVITVDHAISVFAGLCAAGAEYSRQGLPLLLGHFETCRAKEIPQHLERASVCFTADNVEDFREIASRRDGEMSDSQRARVRKIFKGF